MFDPATKQVVHHQDRAYARSACEGALQRLGTTYIDLFTLRGPVQVRVCVCLWGWGGGSESAVVCACVCGGRGAQRRTLYPAVQVVCCDLASIGG
jgi:hypothetical protein